MSTMLFLNGILQENIYMEQLMGFEKYDGNNPRQGISPKKKKKMTRLFSG